MRRKFLDFPDLRRAHGGRPLDHQQLRAQRLDRRRQQPGQRSRRLQHEPEQPHHRAVHAIRLDQPSGGRVRQRSDQRRSVLARALHHDAGDGGRHATPSTRPRCWTCGSGGCGGTTIAPGQPGDGHRVDVRSSRGALRPDFRTQRRSPANPSSINAGSNQVIGTGLIYADDYTYSFTPTLTKITGDHTLKAGANILIGEVNYFQNNNVGGTFTFANNPTALDGTNPGATGDPFASFLIGQPTGGTYQSSNFNYGRSKYQAYFVEDSWQMNSRLTLNLGLRLEQPGAYYETEDRLVTFNPDVVNPLLAGRTNPETGRPYPRGVRVGGERRATGAHAAEESLAVCAACRRGVSHYRQHGRARRRRHVLRALDSAISGWADGQPREQQNQQHRDQRRQQPHVLHRPEQPVPDRRRQLSGPRPQLPAGPARGDRQPVLPR